MHPGNMQAVIGANPNLLQESGKRLPGLASDSKSRKLLKAGSPMQNDILLNMKQLHAVLPVGNANATVFGQPRMGPPGPLPGQSPNLNRYIPEARPGYAKG